MKILQISQILPIPGYCKTNNFVIKLTDYNLAQYPQNTIFILRPVPYTNRILAKYLQEISISLPANFKEYRINSHLIKVIKFLSAWKFRSLHALLSYSAYWFNRKRIHDIVKKNEIEVIHAQFIFPDGLIALKLKKKFHIPYIITTHSELRYFESSISRRLALSVLKNAYWITPLNYRSTNYFKGLGYKNTELIPLGIDKRFLLKAQDSNTHKEFRIITMGDLIALKNVDKVLRAVSLIKQKFQVKYTIIGQGLMEEDLKKLTQSLQIDDVVDFRGYIEHEKLPEIIVNHDLFILPSYPETFGRVYFEAMGAGLPVICAMNSGIYGYFPDLVDKYAVNPDNPEDIAQKIEWFIRNEESRKKIGAELQQWVSNYTWDKISDRLNQLYHKAIVENI